MTYPAKAIANFFISKALHDKELPNDLTLMKLIKLIYIAHGWNLAINHQELINEPVEAWQYGPVVNSVYQEFKHYGNNPIKSVAIDYDFYSEPGRVRENKYDVKFDADTLALLERMWDVYKVNTGIQLSNWTHLEGSPWYQTWYGKQGWKDRSLSIPNSLIKNYFVEELRKAKENGESQRIK